jgi:hypothetical protein
LWNHEDAHQGRIVLKVAKVVVFCYHILMSDNRLEQQVSEYAKLAKEDKNIDVASLMLNAISQTDNDVSGKTKKWAYLISIGLPPFGLLFALKFYLFSDKDDARGVANVCVILTLLSVGVIWLTAKILLSSSGTSLEQIQQITPQEIHDTIGN